MRAKSRFSLLVVAVVLAVGGSASARPAAAIGCTTTDLVNAVAAANSNPGADTIELPAGCTYTFSTVDNWWYGPNALPAISSAITIQGNGAVLDSASTAGRLRFFFVGADPSADATKDYTTPGAGNLTLEDLTLRNGLQKGGDSSIGGGGAGLGGAVFNQGSLTLERVTLSGNKAQGGARIRTRAVAAGVGSVKTLTR